MKKALALILVAVLVIAIAVPVAANDILGATLSSELPELARKHDNVRLHEKDNILELHEEDQQTMADAEEALKYVDTKGLGLRYFFYTEILTDELTVTLEFEPIPHNEIMFMQYIDGMWVTLEHSVGDDQIITVPKNMDAPLAIFVDGLASPGGSWAKLTPILTDESALIVQLHSLEEVETLSEEIQNQIAEAKEKLEETCPAGFAVKYFFEMEILGTDAAVDVDFEPIEHNEIVFKQYVNGAWAELEHSIEAGDIITVYGLVNGPVAVFIK